MTTATMNAPSLLLHLLRNDVELSTDADGLIVEGGNAKRMMPLIQGRAYDLIVLLGSRVDWFRDTGLREV